MHMVHIQPCVRIVEKVMCFVAMACAAQHVTPAKETKNRCLQKSEDSSEDICVLKVTIQSFGRSFPNGYYIRVSGNKK